MSAVLAEYAPIDESIAAEQRQAGYRGLAIWGVSGIVIALWLGLRWKIPRG